MAEVSGVEIAAAEDYSDVVSISIYCKHPRIPAEVVAEADLAVVTAVSAVVIGRRLPVSAFPAAICACTPG